VSRVKRLIGRRFDDPITKKDTESPLHIVKGANGDAWVRRRQGYSPARFPPSSSRR